MGHPLDDIRSRGEEIRAIARRWGAYNVRVFGSWARGDATPDSDIDLVVSFERGRNLLDIIRFKQALEDLLGRKVDVVEEGAAIPEVNAQILQEAVPL